MKKLRLLFWGCSIAFLGMLFLPDLARAQDTTWVQTLKFTDITKRRGKWVFPPATKEFRKILMYYTLKCDVKTTHDQYPCGEWDYLTYNQIYDPRGILDSTYMSQVKFKVGNSAPDSLQIAWNPVYSYTREWQYFQVNTATLSFDSTLVGTGNGSQPQPFQSSEQSGKAQFLWRASELASAGLTAGAISGLRLDLSSLGSTLKNLEIRLKHTTLDSLTPYTAVTGLDLAYRVNTTFSASGWNSLQFTQPFVWNGADNIVVEFSFDALAGGTDNEVRTSTTTFPSGIFSSGLDYALDFTGGGRFLNLGKDPQVTGNAPRTIEAWAYTRAFNNGGLFQAGATGSTAKDFSLRTNTTANSWRVQCWGAPDFDVTLAGSQNSWHHFAVTYDGSTTRLYYDGALAGSKNYPLNTTAHDLWIGDWNGSFFNGLVDEIRTWDTVLNGNTLKNWMHQDLSSSHPHYSHLKGHYQLNEGSGILAQDASFNNNAAGQLSGLPWWERIQGNAIFRGFTQTSERPNVIFEQGTYTSYLDSIAVIDSTLLPPAMVVLYENPANGTQIPDNASNHPSLPTDTLVVWQAGQYTYTYDKNSGLPIDSTWIGSDSTLYQDTLEWYSPLSVFEIGRFITPYGINLDLGPNGFTWIYDVTDYAPLLVDTVDFSAGNQQELIDVKFMMIEGTPPHDFRRISKVWGGMASHSYKNLDDDTDLSAATHDLDPAAEYFKVKTRLTGHGHNSNDGSYPHCCEWKDNTHYLLVNGQQVKSWHIWQDPQCAMNPVYPQGGTWPGLREGWCPGDLVKETEINITPYVTGSTVTLDYDITPVPSNNQGMGGGNYVVAAHLLQFDAPNHTLDAEVYDIITPNSWEYYSRMNPICNEPKFILRNAGSGTLNSVKVTYGVEGGSTEQYTWNGSLDFLETAEVALPVPDATFWQGNGAGKFNISLSLPNGGTDQYSDNDTYTVEYNQPDTLPEDIVIYFKTNSRPQENIYTLKDMAGNIIIERKNLLPEWYYYDTLHLTGGCYTLEMTDSEKDGISYWADPAAGTGLFRIYGAQGGLYKAFLSEFGYKLHYPFVVGTGVSVKEPHLDQVFSVYPNPNAGKFNVEVMGLPGEFRLELVNMKGQVVRQETITSGGIFRREYDLSREPAGMYVVRLSDGENSYARKIMVQNQ
ncbi:MAG: T9SS type A sorting domain-containing protein [Bacteroidia bacterium]|nr:T9SS type A sorting domain-containing protein [Bacteroidia bacterium]